MQIGYCKAKILQPLHTKGPNLWQLALSEIVQATHAWGSHTRDKLLVLDLRLSVFTYEGIQIFLQVSS